MKRRRAPVFTQPRGEAPDKCLKERWMNKVCGLSFSLEKGKTLSRAVIWKDFAQGK